MHLDTEPLGMSEYQLTLTVDASGLAAGSYHGWVRMVDTCVGCTRVNLTVAPLVGVPDAGSAEITSWSGVKSKYR